MARNVRSDEGPVTPAKAKGGGSGRNLADQLARLGITRDADVVLHLPLRYEDHTRLVALPAVQAGLAVQTEGVVLRTEIQYRPRRQLVSLIADPDHREAQLVLRFFTFYPSQQKALQPGQRVRVFGDVRPGYFGLEIVHPQWKAVAEGAPLPDRLTPVYPTTAGLSQDTLRKLVARTMAGDPSLTEDTLPEQVVKRHKLWKFGDAVRFLHAPPPRVNELTQK
jgi:ATP-dependent DNA helicase RecG